MKLKGKSANINVNELFNQLSNIIPPTPLTESEDKRLMVLRELADEVGIESEQFPIEEFSALLFKRNPKMIQIGQGKNN